MKYEAKVQLRIPEDVHRWLVGFAAANDRSMNGQMVSLLRDKMQEQPSAKGKERNHA